MSLLLLSDLHYLRGDPQAEARLEEVLAIDEPVSAVVLCGDNADLTTDVMEIQTLYAKLRERFGDVGAIAGNHCLWGKHLGLSAQHLLFELHPKIAAHFGVVYIEQQNWEIDGWTIAGTYGHYDYSLSHWNRADLVRGKTILPGEITSIGKDGKVITERNQLSYRDKEFIDLGEMNDEALCSMLLDGFESRAASVKENLLTISHTLPNSSLNSYPFTLDGQFLASYNGSSRIGEIIRELTPKYHFCGHTHRPARTTLGTTDVINIGSGKDLCYVLLDESGVRWKK